jgi:hypothetical protein
VASNARPGEAEGLALQEDAEQAEDEGQAQRDLDRDYTISISDVAQRRW